MRAVAPYRLLTPEQRNAAHAAEDALLDAAIAARLAGWRLHERDWIAAEARRLGVTIWPALCDRLNRAAHEAVGGPF